MQSAISCASSTASLPTNAPLSPPPSLVNQRNHQVSTSSVHHQALPRASSAGAIQLMPVMSTQNSIYASNQSNQMCNQSNHMANQSNQMCNQSNQMVNQSNAANHTASQLISSHHVAPSTTQSQIVLVSTPSSSLMNPISVGNSAPSVSTLMNNPMLSGNAMGECTICYERQIDSVLYTCGHMCMCYRCAVQQWRGKGGGQCPMCRAPIRDVIRTYKS